MADESTQEGTGAVQEEIADKVEAAGLATIDTPEGVRGPGEIAAAILEGEIDPDEVDDAVIKWVNTQVDIPFIGEAAEARLLETVAGVVKSAITSFLRTL